VDFYGGVAAYTKFISGDLSPWSCSAKAYIPTGKILFAIDAYWQVQRLVYRQQQIMHAQSGM
jgi:hypothetical protein